MSLALAEEIGMAAGPDQDDFLWQVIVDQEPIWLDMAFPEPGVFAREFVWAHAVRQIAAVEEDRHDLQ